LAAVEKDDITAPRARNRFNVILTVVLASLLLTLGVAWFQHGRSAVSTEFRVPSRPL